MARKKKLRLNALLSIDGIPHTGGGVLTMNAAALLSIKAEMGC